MIYVGTLRQRLSLGVLAYRHCGAQLSSNLDGSTNKATFQHVGEKKMHYRIGQIGIALALSLCVQAACSELASAQCSGRGGSGSSNTGTTATNSLATGYGQLPMMQNVPSYNQRVMQQLYNQQQMAMREQAWLQQTQYVQRMQRQQRNERLARENANGDSNELLSSSKSRLASKQKKAKGSASVAKSQATANDDLKLAAK